MVLRYLKYYRTAQTKYRIHSPFVYDFCESVLDDDRQFYTFSEVEALRDLVKKDKRIVPNEDYGAGSHYGDSNKKTIAQIAKQSLTSLAFCQILFRLIQTYKPVNCIELGTSLGISTIYQADGNLDANFYSIEGNAALAGVARNNVARLKRKNINILSGKFEEQLPVVLKKLPKVDYVFFDGNHRKEPTIDYFNQCLTKAHSDSIFVFDDIHWSEGMEAAWNEIKQHSRVTLTVDLFYCGIVFFRKEQKIDEHFTLIPTRWKPWDIGMSDLLSG